MNIRMKDIAKKANVSVTTVSRVIHNNGYVAKKTEKKILKIINENNYSIDGVAQSLRKKKTNTIGFIMTQIYPDPFQSAIAHFLEAEAKKNGFRLLISNISDKAEEERYALDLFAKYRVDGVIFGYLNDVSNAKFLKKIGVPFVLIERRRNLKGVNAVIFDFYKAIRISMDHLISKGARKIGFIGAKLGDEVENDIFQSYKDSLSENGLVLDKDLVHFGWMNAGTGYDGINNLYKNNNIPDACIVINDITALGVLQALNNLNISVPDDMMIISCDNTLSGYSTPPLTSISFKKEKIAQTAFTMIINKIKKINTQNEIVTLGPRLIKRESTKD